MGKSPFTNFKDLTCVSVNFATMLLTPYCLNMAAISRQFYLLKRIQNLLFGAVFKYFRLTKFSLPKEMWFRYLTKRYGPKMRSFDTSGLSGASDVRDRGPNVLGLPQLSLLSWNQSQSVALLNTSFQCLKVKRTRYVLKSNKPTHGQQKPMSGPVRFKLSSRGHCVIMRAKPLNEY